MKRRSFLAMLGLAPVAAVVGASQGDAKVATTVWNKPSGAKWVSVTAGGGGGYSHTLTDPGHTHNLPSHTHQISYGHGDYPVGYIEYFTEPCASLGGATVVIAKVWTGQQWIGAHTKEGTAFLQMLHDSVAYASYPRFLGT